MHDTILRAYQRAARRLFLLDYDGTLVALQQRPELAVPSSQLLEVLARLVADQRNLVAVVSGRRPEDLDEWLGNVGIDLSAEHGHFIKQGLGGWQRVLQADDSWKQKVRPMLEEVALQVPHSFVEEKHTGLVWHYRLADQSLAKTKVKPLLGRLQTVPGITFHQGAKMVDARLAGRNKGDVARTWLTLQSFDFVLAAGDDTTDEDLFAALAPSAFTIKIGDGPTQAREKLASPADFLQLLQRISSKR